MKKFNAIIKISFHVDFIVIFTDLTTNTIMNSTNSGGEVFNDEL